MAWTTVVEAEIMAGGRIWDILMTEPTDVLMAGCGKCKSRIITRSWPKYQEWLYINIIIILQFVASCFIHLRKNNELPCASLHPPQHCENDIPKVGAE